ncbi:2OG-Fe(II) oxygenase [Cognatiluteimonas profundi]|uniref:2OG-Fe(II) oxygenase n=1 Tax=Cognatiluteimonas profundi TaxID=2594501 RepID=UPI00131C6A7A|nr:2OG-Fe(II) oxygenase [Lysobacter profundi]
MHALKDYIRVYDNALEDGFCANLVAGFEQMTELQRRNGRGIRPGLDNSAWTEMNIGTQADKAFLGFFLAQVDTYLARYNSEVPLTIPVPLRPKTDRLTLKRYHPQVEGFEPHFDSIDDYSSRYMVFLWYLNTVEEGGETEFCDLGIKVAPKAGRLLMFPPYWMFQHAGRPPISGDKYILSTYLMF